MIRHLLAKGSQGGVTVVKPNVRGLGWVFLNPFETGFGRIMIGIVGLRLEEPSCPSGCLGATCFHVVSWRLESVACGVLSDDDVCDEWVRRLLGGWSVILCLQCVWIRIKY
jgi:hypothetical protein